MYCKSLSKKITSTKQAVLIVAKCIVNVEEGAKKANSAMVLIVAKCIVNNENIFNTILDLKVLIVAKCIVNFLAS